MSIHENIKKLYQSKTAKMVITALLVVIAILAVFQAGVMVGFRKAQFSFRFGDSYYRTFGGNSIGRGDMNRGGKDDMRNRMGNMIGIQGRDMLTGGHGAIGRILKVDSQTIVLIGPDGVEKVITVNDATEIRRFRDKIAVSELKVDDTIVVIGSPDEKGNIIAKLIRTVPAPPEGMMQGMMTAPSNSQ